MSQAFQKTVLTVLTLFLCGFVTLATPKKPLIIGHMLSWSVYGNNYYITSIPAERLTHLIYGFANISGTGEVMHGDAYADILNTYPGDDPAKDTVRGNFHQMQLLKKRYPGLKIILSVGGWAWSKKFSDTVLTAQSRDRFIKSLVRYIQTYQFDGVEIDWEYPMRGGAPDNVHRSEDGENFILLVTELRKQLNRLEEEEKQDYWLSAVLSVEPIIYKGMDLVRLAEPVDYLSLMSINFSGSWNKRTAHQSPLHSSDGEKSRKSHGIAEYIQQLIQLGVPPEKLLFAISPRAASWGGVSNKNNGLSQQSKTVPHGAYDTQNNPPSGTYGYTHVLNMIKDPAYQLHWDNQSKASYLYNPDRYDGHFVSFESERSLKSKLNFVEAEQLGGVILRFMETDSTGKDSLIRVIHKRFYPEKFYLIKGREILQEYWFALFLLSLSLLILISIIIYQKRRRGLLQIEDQEYIQDKLEHDSLSRSLQGMNTPLLGLISLADDFESYQDKLSYSAEREKLTQLREKSRQLAMVVHMVLNHTNLSQNSKPPNFQSLDSELSLRQVVNISTPQRRQKSIAVDWQVDPSLPPLRADEGQLQEILQLSMDRAFDSAKHSGTISLSLREEVGEIALSITDPDPAIPLAVQHFPELERLQQLTGQQGGNFSVVPTGLGQQFRLSFPKSELPPNNTKGNLKIILPRDEESLRQLSDVASDSEEQSQVNVPIASKRIVALQEFAEQLGQFKDVESLLEILFDFFVSDNQSNKVTLLQEGKVLKHSDSEQTTEETEAIEKSYNDLEEQKTMQLAGEEGKTVFATPQGFSDYTFVIECGEEPSQDDLDYFNSLVSQATMVRQQLYELVKRPQLLSELYEIASRRNTLLFIKAEKGYSGIYEKATKKPVIICSRLKKLKLYFDDQSLLQIHRSYLINPTKVSEIRKLSKSKYEIELGGTRIPVGGIYLDRLKKQKPEWFTLLS